MRNVRAATSDDLDALAEVLADGFVDEPVMSWAFPDAAGRPRLLQAMFGFLAEHLYQLQGQCTIAPDAAALWRPTGVESSDEFWEEHGDASRWAARRQLRCAPVMSETGVPPIGTPVSAFPEMRSKVYRRRPERRICCSKDSSVQSKNPQAKTNTSTFALPPLNKPLSGCTSAVHARVVPSQRSC